MNAIFKITCCISLIMLGSLPCLADEFCDSLNAIAATAPGNFDMAYNKKLWVHGTEDMLSKPPGCLGVRLKMVLYHCYLADASRAALEKLASRIAACLGSAVPVRDDWKYHFRLQEADLTLEYTEISDGRDFVVLNFRPHTDATHKVMP